MKKAQAEELNLAHHSSLGCERFSQISSEKQTLGPPWAEVGMGCGFPHYQEVLSQLSQHLLHKGVGSGLGTWLCFAQPAEQWFGWKPTHYSQRKPNVLELNSSLSGRAGCQTTTTTHGSKCHHAEAGCLRGMRTLPRSWVRHLCLLSTGSARRALCSVQVPAAFSEGDERPSSALGPALPCLSSRHLHPPVHLNVSCSCLFPRGSLWVLL